MWSSILLSLARLLAQLEWSAVLYLSPELSEFKWRVIHGSKDLINLVSVEEVSSFCNAVAAMLTLCPRSWGFELSAEAATQFIVSCWRAMIAFGVP